MRLSWLVRGRAQAQEKSMAPALSVSPAPHSPLHKSVAVVPAGAGLAASVLLHQLCSHELDFLINTLSPRNQPCKPYLKAWCDLHKKFRV